MDSRREALHPLTCILGHARPVVMERLLRDLVAFGVEAIIVVATELGEKSYLQSNLWQPERLQRTLLAGAQIAEATSTPYIARYWGVRQALEKLCGAKEENNPTELRYLFEPDMACLATLPVPSQPPHRALIAVGPERGWSTAEVALFQANGFTAVSLGARALRSEAAAVCAVALTLARAGWL